ncbi:MAG: ATP-binding protein [Chromatiaceae bacterium]
MNDVFSSGCGIEHLGLCALPIGHDVLARLLEPSAMPDQSTRTEVALLAGDPVFCACAASAATSAAFRVGGPVSFTLESVIRRLGPRGLIALAAHTAIRQQYAAASLDAVEAFRELRARGILRARIALALAERSGYERVDEAYFAALLLDLGRIALLALADAPELAGDSGGGEDELGARLIASWGYSSLVSDAFRYQSEQAQQLADAHPLVRIAHCARRLSEAEPSRLSLVCNEVAALMGGDVAEIRRLAEMASAAAGEPEPQAQPATPAANSDAQDAPLVGLVARRALLGEIGAYWSAADTEKEMLHAVAQALAIFFGVRQMLYLQRDGHLLRGLDLFGAGPAVSEISVRVNSARLIARAAANTALLHTLDSDPSILTVIDKQAMGVLACAGMLCLPIASDSECPGVFIAGLHPARRNWVEQHQPLLQGFAAQAGQALASVRRRQAHASWNRQESRADCNLRARRTAHEVSTPLSVIRNYVSVIEMKLAQGQPVEGDLAVITNELTRSERIIREFSEGFRDQADARELALNPLVRELAALLEDTLIKDRGIKLTLNLDDRVPATLDLDAYAVRQVLINLARNALEALHEGDGLQLSTEDGLRFEDDDYVAVSVSDSGPGLPADVLGSLFEPVRSTKGQEHQGLGLSIVKDLADRMGARIICRSGAGAGTTFTMLLPRKTAAAAPFTSARLGNRP